MFVKYLSTIYLYFEKSENFILRHIKDNSVIDSLIRKYNNHKIILLQNL